MNDELTLYFREGCHLCDAMRKALHRYGQKYQPVTWQEVDIDGEAELIARYDTLVPVLCLGREEICHHFFDEAQLIAAITADH